MLFWSMGKLFSYYKKKKELIFWLVIAIFKKNLKKEVKKNLKKD